MITERIARKVSRAIDSRVRAAKFVRAALNHVFPDHWSFMLGEIALYSFLVLLVTGTYLALFFHASSAKVIYHGAYHPLDGQKVSVAYQSVLHICFEVPAGLLVRQMHHWAALIFIWAILAHMARIFLTAAYRKPREMNWLIGLTLLVLALVNGFFGYSMLDDLLSGTGLRIGYAILLSVPIVGPWLTYLFMGGNIPNPEMLPRMYALHIFLVPVLISGLLGMHLFMIWRQLHTNYPGPKRTNRMIVGSRLWPSYTAKSIGLLLLVFGVIAALGGLVQIDPVWIYGPYDPSSVMVGAQPDWYLGWVEGAMRLFPGVHLRLGHWLIPELFFPAVLMPSLLFLGLYSVPFVEKLFSSDEGDQNVLRLPYEQPVLTALGSALATFVLILLVAGGDDFLALAVNGSVVEIRTILRILVLCAPPCVAAVTYMICVRWKQHKAAAAAAMAEPSAAILMEEAVDMEAQEALPTPPGDDAVLSGGDEIIDNST